MAETRNSGIELGFWVSLGYLMQALGLLTSDAGRASFISIFTVSLSLSFDSKMKTFTSMRGFDTETFQIIVEFSGSSPCVGVL